MWRMIPRLAIATLTATLALAALPAQEAGAAAIQSYNYTTSATLGDVSNGPISLSGVGDSGSILTTPGAFTLGTITTNPLPSTATLTYDHTPFTIDLKITALPDGSGAEPGSYTFRIQGELNGSIRNGYSDMLASVTSITGNPFNDPNTTPPFAATDLQLGFPQGVASPNGSSFGTTTLIGQVLVAGTPLPPAAPEPTSVAAFAVAIVGWGLRRRLRRSQA
ncbi:PEP-CTERM sorting domain-containing protein [Tundrisphaera lichenicola]|uniref:PEP-CTERM sorting domain-containing protein n=1 Tax=Tundrisphaera lichenicola TaxID=2029860 RepID=UPI003EBA8DAD